MKNLSLKQFDQDVSIVQLQNGHSVSDSVQSNENRIEFLAEQKFYVIKAKYDKFGEITNHEIIIKSPRILEKLREFGFKRMDINNVSYLIRVKDNIIEEVDTKLITDEFDNYMKSLPDLLEEDMPLEMLLDKMYKAQSTYFSKEMLYRLKTDEVFEFNEDTLHEAFFYFKNGYVKITREKREFLEYSKLTKKIWKSQIVEREYKELKKSDYKTCKWALFVSLIAGNKLDEKGNETDKNRYEDLQRIIGYCLHKYYEDKLKALVFTDSKISDNELQDSGRSGKTLLCKGMSHILNATKNDKVFCEVSGKEFDDLDRFKWQDLNLNTRLVHLNDVKKNFNFENRFNDITEGIKCQRKNELPFMIQCKMIFSTNKTIKIHGGSAKDRVTEFQMSDYFSDQYTPSHEFSEWFFRDWDDSRWNEFYNFMLSCVQVYLAKGLPKPRNFNLETRKLREETSGDFITYIAENIMTGHAIYKKEMLNDFKYKFPDNEKVTLNKLTIWLNRFAEYQKDNVKITETRDREKADTKLLFEFKVIPPSNDTNITITEGESM